MMMAGRVAGVCYYAEAPALAPARQRATEPPDYGEKPEVWSDGRRRRFGTPRTPSKSLSFARPSLDDT